MKPQSYQDLGIYRLSRGLAAELHKVVLEELPGFEKYEEGSQIRRSSKSVCANIVEGFGRKHYKGEYIQFLTYALSSCDETKCHLDLLKRTNSLCANKSDYFMKKYSSLGAMIYCFRKRIIENSD